MIKNTMNNYIQKTNEKDIVQLLVIHGNDFVITEVISQTDLLLVVKGTFNIAKAEVLDGKKILTLFDSDIYHYRFTEDVIDYSYFDKKLEIKII